jgi:ATP-dependent helicase HrpB
VPAPLPIDELIPDIVTTTRSAGRLVLRAPPGAGKTTRVPAALLDAGLAGGKQIVVLEPRRIAARAAAEFVARERGGAVGGEVGYRVRFERKGGSSTRLWFLTEGMFSRGLAADPFLEDVGVVVLDEFHERHLQSDLALGVVRELQESVRPDLKLVVMSATLDTAPVSTFLRQAPVLTSQGRAFAVAVAYERENSRAPLAKRVATAVARALTTDAEGDLLVFLPGAAEIRRASEAIAEIAAARGVDVVPLHGDLPLDAQRRALERGARRRVVLSTNVAETALTIAGVRTVVDSGLAREARFDPRHGVNRLEEVRISRAAAEQRAGRAGRIGPGRCLRLWTAAQHAERRERETPEVLRLDLSSTVLELRAWGVGDLRSFAWLDPPREGSLESAERLLEQLGALTADGVLTDTGRRMLALPASPRLARMLIEAEARGAAADGALAAALASERDVLLERRAFAAPSVSPWPSGSSDLLLRMDLFRQAEREGLRPQACRSLGLDPAAVRAVDRARRQLHSSARAAPAAEDAVLRCVLAGFPDRVARRRSPGSSRGIMVGGTGVAHDPQSVVRDAEFFVAVDLEAGARVERAEGRVRLASAIEPEWLYEMFPGQVRRTSELVFDAAAQRVIARDRRLYQDLVLAETIHHDVDPLTAGELVIAEAKRDPANALTIGPDERAFLDRVEFLGRAMPGLGLPADSEQLLRSAIDALGAGKRSFTELRRGDLRAALRAQLSPRQRHALEREAPEHLLLPSGRHARLQYERDKPPSFAARIQELFGLAATPRIAAGTVRIVTEILAPSNRPVQVTDDLESFWTRTYPEVRKQLRGRYPKHSWPESPQVK